MDERLVFPVQVAHKVLGALGQLEQRLGADDLAGGGRLGRIVPCQKAQILQIAADLLGLGSHGALPCAVSGAFYKVFPYQYNTPGAKNGILFAGWICKSFRRGLYALCQHRTPSRTIAPSAPAAAGPTGPPGGPGPAGPPARSKWARAALHFWEEPCISGTRGSGTVFFSGCALKCCYCQNYPSAPSALARRSASGDWRKFSSTLQRQGAHNINLVTPGQWQPWIIAALDQARAGGLRLPIVCNTGSYETLDSIRRWQGYVDIWLADLKYVSPALSARLSSAPDYFQVAKAGHRGHDVPGRPPRL